MLTSPASAPRERGLTLIELLVTLTIAAGLMALAAPAFSTWMTNVRIRTTAESILSGINYAKSEAAGRNTTVRFQLTSSLDATCALSTTASNWVVDVVDTSDSNDSPAGACNAALSDTVQPAILQKRSSQDGSGNTTVSASASNVAFTGLGRVTPVPTTSITINVGNSNVGTCADAGGTLACLRVLVSPDGQVRMCNPKFQSSDPQGCP